MLQTLDIEMRGHRTHHLPLLAIILSIVMFLLSSCTDKTPGIQHLNNSIRYMEDGDFNSAIIEAKNAVAKLPDTVSSRKNLGQLYLKMGDPESAEREISIARRLSAEDYSLVALLARSLARQGKADEVLSIDISNLSSKDKADTLVSMAYAHLSREQSDAAVSNIAQARKLDPQSTYALLAQAKIELLEEQVKNAETLIQNTMEIEPNNQEAWELTGDIRTREGDLAGAESAYEMASSYALNSFSSILKNAQVKTLLGKLDEAQEIAIELKKSVTDNPDIELLLGLIHYYQNDLTTAQTYFERALTIDNKHEGAVYQLSITHLRLGNLGQASEYSRKYLLLNPDSTHGKKLSGRIQIENKNYKLAEELIWPLVLLDDGDVVASQLLASALFKQGKMDEAVSVLTAASADHITSSDFSYQSDSEILLRDLDSGYSAEIGKYTSYQSTIGEIVRLINNDHTHLALTKALEFTEYTPDLTTPWNLLGNIQYTLGNVKDAEISFLKADKLSPGDPTAGYFLAEMAITDSNLLEARKRYVNVLDHNPNHMQTLLGLAYLNALSDDQSAMIDRLEEANKSNPNALKPKILIARLNISVGSENDAIELLQALPDSQSNRPAALITLTMAQLQARKFSDARSTLDRLDLVHQKDPTWYYLSSKVYEGLVQYGAAKEELIKALELDGNYEPAKNGLDIFNALFADSSNVIHSDSLTLNDDMKSRQSELHSNSEITSVNDGLGYEYGTNRDSSKIDILPLFSEAKKHWHRGNRSEAISMLKDLKINSPDNLEVRHTLALGYADSGNIDNAITEFREIIQLNPLDHIALNNLAWYLKEKNPEMAIEHAQKALEIAPDALEILDTIAAIKLKPNDLPGASSESITR